MPTGRPLEKLYRSVEEVERTVAAYAGREDAVELENAHRDLWMLAGASACPREKTLEQQEKYFGKLKFSTLEELLELAKRVEFI